MSEIDEILRHSFKKCADYESIVCRHKKHDTTWESNLDLTKSQLYKLLVSKAEQRQILVGWKKNMEHEPVHKDWQAIPISAINEIFGEVRK